MCVVFVKMNNDSFFIRILRDESQFFNAVSIIFNDEEFRYISHLKILKKVLLL